jgi:hypothetical protein
MFNATFSSWAPPFLCSAQLQRLLLTDGQKIQGPDKLKDQVNQAPTPAILWMHDIRKSGPPLAKACLAVDTANANSSTSFYLILR